MRPRDPQLPILLLACARHRVNVEARPVRRCAAVKGWEEDAFVARSSQCWRSHAHAAESALTLIAVPLPWALREKRRLRGSLFSKLALTCACHRIDVGARPPPTIIAAVDV